MGNVPEANKFCASYSRKPTSSPVETANYGSAFPVRQWEEQADVC